MNRNGWGDGWGGGAIYASYAQLIIRESTFSGNVANSGPGGAIRPHKSVLDVAESTFLRNRVTGLSSGGAISLDRGQRASFRNVVFASNSCGHGIGQDGTATVVGFTWRESCIVMPEDRALDPFDRSQQCRGFRNGGVGGDGELYGGSFSLGERRHSFGGSLYVMGSTASGEQNMAVVGCVNCSFLGSRATVGGGMYVGGNAKVFLNGQSRFHS